MKATTSPIYRWRVGEVEITRVLEFEAALFEPAVIHPEASPEIIERHRAVRRLPEHRPRDFARNAKGCGSSRCRCTRTRPA
jgi:hypothetical protein